MYSRLSRFIVVTMGMAFVLTACVSIPKHDFEAPAPEGAVQPTAPGTVTITLQNIDARGLDAALRANVPQRIDAQRFPGGCANPCYRFGLRGMDTALSGGRLELTASYGGSIQAAGSFGSCTLDPFFVSARISAKPEVRKVDDTWVIAPTGVRATPSIDPGSDTHCTIAGFDVGGMLLERLQSVVNGVADQVAGRRIPIPVDDLAAKLLGPLEIPGDNGLRYCLYSRVTDAQLGAISASSAAATPAGSLPQSIDIPVAFIGAPSLIVTKDSCAPAEPLTTPLRLGTDATTQPYRLLATVAADYPALSDFVTSKLKPIHQRWGALNLTFKPTKVDIGNANGQVLAAVRLTGSLSGTVYFWGTPLPTPDGKGVFISDLHLAAESKTALESKDMRLPDVVVNAFKPAIEQALDEQIKAAMSVLDNLNNAAIALPGGGQLSLGAFDLTVAGIKSVVGQLKVDVLLVGQASGTAQL